MIITKEGIKYQNGNCLVTIYPDGSKTREYEGEPNPKFPESIDLKITNRCDRQCDFCHEQSTPDGSFADEYQISYRLRGLPPGVEIAIGGGNPLIDMDRFINLLTMLKAQGLIANVTAHSDVFLINPSLVFTVKGLIASDMIDGLGLSGSLDMFSLNDNYGLIDNNTVLHFIIGLNTPAEVVRCPHEKILLLGFKSHGRALSFAKEQQDKVARGIKEWKYWLPTLISKRQVSFDNLALEQLAVKAMLPPEVWEKHYMGPDASFSFYIDAVKGEYARNSTSKRYPWKNMSAMEMFCDIRKKEGLD